MKQKSVLAAAAIILIIGILAELGYHMYFQWQIELSRGHLWAGNNEIDRMIKKIYSQDLFLEEAEPEEDEFWNYVDLPEPETVIHQKLFSISYNDTKYHTTDTRLERNCIGKKLEDTKGYFYDESGSIDIELFRIQNISFDAAVAVRAVNTDLYYVFANEEYQADNMETYLKSYGIDIDTNMGEIYLSDHKGKYYIYYKDIPAKEVMDLITGADKKLIQDEERNRLKIEQTGLSFSIYSDILKEKIHFQIMEDGYLEVGNRLARTRLYDCGKDEISKALEVMGNTRKKHKGILNKIER